MKSCASTANCNFCSRRAECSTYQSNKNNMSESESTYESKVKDPASWLNPKWY